MIGIYRLFRVSEYKQQVNTQRFFLIQCWNRSSRLKWKKQKQNEHRLWVVFMDNDREANRVQQHNTAPITPARRTLVWKNSSAAKWHSRGDAHTHTHKHTHPLWSSFSSLRCCCTPRKKKNKKKKNSWRKCATLEQMDTPESRFCEQKAWTKTVKLSGRQLKQQAERCYKCARNWMKL